MSAADASTSSEQLDLNYTSLKAGRLLAKMKSVCSITCLRADMQMA